MGIKRIVAAIVLLDFFALNVYALNAQGVGGLFAQLQSLGPWGWVLTADLVIALSMVIVWMWDDARKSGRNPWGYTLLTLGTGSIGTLLYYVTRKGAAAAEGTVTRGAKLAVS